MNTHPLAPRPPQPILLALTLAERLRATFPQIRQSATLLVQWLRAQVGLHQQWSTEAAGIAAELTAERALITKCLANDSPRDRRHIEAALDAIHAHQLAHAAQLAPRLPASLAEPNDKVRDGGPVASDSTRDATPPFSAPLG